MEKIVYENVSSKFDKDHNDHRHSGIETSCYGRQMTVESLVKLKRYKKVSKKYFVHRFSG